MSEVLCIDNKRIRRKVVFNNPLPEENIVDSFSACPGKRKECESTQEYECNPKRAKISSEKQALLTKVSKKILDTIGENSSDEDIYSNGSSELEDAENCGLDGKEKDFSQDNEEEEYTKDGAESCRAVNSISFKADKEINKDVLLWYS